MSRLEDLETIILSLARTHNNNWWETIKDDRNWQLCYFFTIM